MTSVHIMTRDKNVISALCWSVENISRLHFTTNESKVVRPEKIKLELVYLISHYCDETDLFLGLETWLPAN